MKDEHIIRHCSPTLAGIKTANLFSCNYLSKEQLKNDLRRLNRSLSDKGVRVIALRVSEQRALIYVYRPEMLGCDLSCIDAENKLRENGYVCEKPSHCIINLINRLKEDEFPHEIGFFLGYPTEDVIGFIENNAKDHKYSGQWKVYGDVDKAKALFELYDRCTDEYVNKFKSGKTIDDLTVRI